MKKISVYLMEADHRALKSSLSAKGSNFQEFFHEAAKSAMAGGVTKGSISSTNTNAAPVGDDPLMSAIYGLKGNRRAMVAIQALVEALTGRDLNDETENLDRAAAAARSLGETVEKARTAVRKTTTRKGA